MDKFTIIYRILKTLEKAMSVEMFDPQTISPERLKINDTLWKNIIIMLAKKNYVEGVIITEDFDGVSVNVQSIKITLDGLEYLNENSLMKRAFKIMTGVKEITGNFT